MSLSCLQQVKWTPQFGLPIIVVSGEVGSRRVVWRASVEGGTSEVGPEEYAAVVKAWQHGFASRRRVPLLATTLADTMHTIAEDWWSVGNVDVCYRVGSSCR